MNSADHKPGGIDDLPTVVFSSAYGGLPRFFWYGVVPFLLLVSAVLFIRAVWFDEGLPLASFRVPPGAVIFAICPLIWLLIGIEVYHRRNPQFILVTSWGVKLPKGRFTTETISIAWEDLQATLEGGTIKGWDVYEIICTDLRNGASARVTSALFRDFDEFATFTLIMADHMGQDWRIKGFWPGTFRGRRPSS
jgi:hypothetical protein